MIMYIPGDTATNMNAHKYALNIVCGIHLKSRAQTGYILIIMASFGYNCTITILSV